MYYELSIMGVIKAAFARKALLKGIAEGLDVHGEPWAASKTDTIQYPNEVKKTSNINKNKSHQHENDFKNFTCQSSNISRQH
jgi:hypothetical protein